MYPALQSAGYGFFDIKTGRDAVLLAHSFDLAFHGNEFITAVINKD